MPINLTHAAKKRLRHHVLLPLSVYVIVNKLYFHVGNTVATRYNAVVHEQPHNSH